METEWLRIFSTVQDVLHEQRQAEDGSVGLESAAVTQTTETRLKNTNTTSTVCPSSNYPTVTHHLQFVPRTSKQTRHNIYSKVLNLHIVFDGWDVPHMQWEGSMTGHEAPPWIHRLCLERKSAANTTSC